MDLHLPVMLPGECTVLMAGAGSRGPGSRKPGVGTQEAQAPGSLSSLPPLQSKVLQMAQEPLNWPLLLSGPRCPLPRCPSAPQAPQPWSKSARSAETGSPCRGQRSRPPGAYTNVTCSKGPRTVRREQHHPLAIRLVPLGFSSYNWTPAGVCSLSPVPVSPVSPSPCWSVSFLRTVTVSASGTRSRARDCRCSETPAE